MSEDNNNNNTTAQDQNVVMDSSSTETQTEPNTDPKKETKFKLKINLKTVFFAFSVILALFVLYLIKGWFIAGVVNWHPISRLTVIKEAEKQAGRGVLEEEINKILVEQAFRKQKLAIDIAEVNKDYDEIEQGIATQNLTMEEYLEGRGMTPDTFREYLILNKKLEKLLGERIAVSNEEIDAFIEENKELIPAEGDQTEIRDRVAGFLMARKAQQETEVLVQELREDARIFNWYKY